MIKLKRLIEILEKLGIDVRRVSITIDADLNDRNGDGREATLLVAYDGNVIYSHAYDLWR